MILCQRLPGLSKEAVKHPLKGSGKVGKWLTADDASDLEHTRESIRAQGSVLRELHAILLEKDPGFGGLARVQNKRREFLWVHPKFVDEY